MKISHSSGHAPGNGAPPGNGASHHSSSVEVMAPHALTTPPAPSRSKQSNPATVVTSIASIASIASMPPAQRVAVMHQLQQDSAALLGTATGLPPMTPDQRLHSSGKWAEGEDKAAEGVLDTMTAIPAAFVIKRRGHAPVQPDIEGARANLTCRASAVTILYNLEQATQFARDAVLAFGDSVHEVTVPAYALAVQLGNRNDDLQENVADAQTLRSKGSRTRKNNQRKAGRAQKTVAPAAAKSDPATGK